MKTLPLIFLVLVTLGGCGVPQEDYNKLEEEHNNLKEEYDNLKETNESLQNKIEEQTTKIYNLTQKTLNLEKKEKALIKEQNTKPYISKAKAIEYLDQDYSFYNRGYVYKDLKVLRVGPNEFKFSMREGKADRVNEDFWYVDQVITLIVNKNGKYKLTRRIYH
jgi:seryl-tRNA synthetase